MDEVDLHNVYRFFTEAGIISQFGNTLVERHLPERMTHQHFGLLGHISRRPEGSTPQQLAYAFQIPKTSMTHMLRVLEELGFLAIAANPRDARSKITRITKLGGELLNSVLLSAAKDIATMDPPIDLALIKRLLPELQSAREQLDDARDSEAR